MLLGLIEHGLAVLARRIDRRAGVVLALAGAMSVASWWGAAGLSFVGTQNLFDPNDPSEVRYRQYAEAFGTAGEAVVLIDTGPAREHEQQANAAAEALAVALRDEPRVASVVWGFDRSSVSPRLLLTQPLNVVKSEAHRIAQLRPMLVSQTPTELLQAGAAEALANTGGDSAAAELAEGAKLFTTLMEVFTQRMQTPADQPVDLFGAMEKSLSGGAWQPMRSGNDRLLVVRVTLKQGVGKQDGYGGSLAALRDHADAIRSRFPTIEMGLTGEPPVRSETESAMRAAAVRAALGGGVGLLLLCGLAWRSVRLPIVVMLVVGATGWWTLGSCGVLLGEMGLLGLIAVGVGGVGGLHGVVMLCGAFVRCGSVEKSLVAVGPAVVQTGLMLGLSGAAVWLGGETQGMRAAGATAIIAAVSVTIGALAIGPAVLVLLTRLAGPEGWQVDERVAERQDAAGLLAQWAHRKPRWAWGAALMIVAAVVTSAMQTGTTLDLSAYLPAESEGAQWQRRSIEDGGERGLAAACLVDDLDQATALTQRLRALPEVARVSGIARLVPEALEAKREVLAALNRQLGNAAREAANPAPPNLLHDPPTGNVMTQVQATQSILQRFGGRLPQTMQPLTRAMDEAAQGFLDAANRLDAEQRRRRLAALQHDYAACRRRVGALVSELLDEQPITLKDIGGAAEVFQPWIAGASSLQTPLDAEQPRGTASAFLGSEAEDATDATDATKPQLLIKIYPTAANGWPTRSELATFFTAVRSVAPEVTGDLERVTVRSQTLNKAAWNVAKWSGVAVGLVLLGFARPWFGAGVGLGVWMLSGMGLRAAMGWLGQEATVAAWLLWPMAGALTAGWAAILIVSDATDERPQDAPRDAPGDTPGNTPQSAPRNPAAESAKPQAVTLRRAAATEGFGLTLAAGFVAAAGLRSAGAPGVTATAVGLCVGAAVAGLVGVLVVRRGRSRS